MADNVTTGKRPAKTRIPLAVGAIVLLLACAIACLAFLRKAGRDEEPAARQAGPTPVLSAAERNRNKARERMEDKEYVATLKELAGTQAALAAERARARAAYDKWLEGWHVSNDTARTLLVRASQPDVDADARAALEQELDGLVRADPEGAALRAWLDEAESAITNHQNLIRGVVGARLRRQGREHAGEELAAEKKLRADYVKAHPEIAVTAAPPRVASVTNFFAARKVVWSNGVASIVATVAPPATNPPPSVPAASPEKPVSVHDGASPGTKK